MKIWKCLLLLSLISTESQCCDVTISAKLQFSLEGTYVLMTCKNISSISEILNYDNIRSNRRYLNVTESVIPTLPSSAFKDLNTLRKLFLSKIHIKTLTPGTFDDLTQIEALYLDNNEIEEVGNNVFNKLHTLNVLDLSNNLISNFDKRGLIGVDNLKVLNLRNNRIVSVEMEFLTGQVNLEKLDLSQNPLEDVSLDNMNLKELLLIQTPLIEDSLSLPSNLTLDVLNMTLGHVNYLDGSLLPKTKYLDLSSNNLSNVIKLRFLTSEIVNFQNNSLEILTETFSTEIKDIQLGYNKLTVLESIFNKSKNLIRLDLRSNQISTIRKNSFEGLDVLEFLNLCDNNIAILDTMWFRDLNHLTFLNLSYNIIQDIPFGSFDTLTSLVKLDISHNRLLSLHQYTFHSLTSLSRLYFENNNITSFNYEDLRFNLRKLQFISLDKNSFTCPYLVRMGRYLKTWGVTIATGTNFDEDNFHGISCINNKEQELSLTSKVIQKVINESLLNSKLDVFFNKGFNQSQFVLYFDKDFEKSNFFKYLNDNSWNNMLIFNSVVQLLVSVLLTVLICLLYLKYFKKIRFNDKSKSSSLMELC